MIRAVFTTLFALLTASLAVVGAATTAVIVAVASGYLPMGTALEWFAEAVRYADYAGEFFGGGLALALVRTARPFVWSALRSRFAEFVRDQVAAQMQQQQG